MCNILSTFIAAMSVVDTFVRFNWLNCKKNAASQTPVQSVFVVSYWVVSYCDGALDVVYKQRQTAIVCDFHTSIRANRKNDHCLRCLTNCAINLIDHLLVSVTNKTS